MLQSEILLMTKQAIRGDNALSYLAKPEGGAILDQIRQIYGSNHRIFAAARQKPFNAASLAKSGPIGETALTTGFEAQSKRNMLAMLLRQRR